MAYKNGTYIAFHANGTSEPTESDMKYYNLMKAWTGKKDSDFEFVNSHDKTAAVRDSSSRETLQRSLKERLNKSKNMVLIIGQTTAQDADWVPFEIAYAVDSCKIPIIATYTMHSGRIVNNQPTLFRYLWPAALARRIDDSTAHVIHIPFKKEPLNCAISQFDHNTFPLGNGLGWYNAATYDGWNIQ